MFVPALVRILTPDGGAVSSESQLMMMMTKKSGIAVQWYRRCNHQMVKLESM